jgi:putative ABC transport system permease protein
MKPAPVVSIAERTRGFSRYFSDLPQAAGNLIAQKFRTSLTMLGIVFGVGAVIGMLAIGAGARQESLRFIEELGVRNVLVESRPATDFQELQVRRRSSPGLTERDVRVLEANIEELELISPRKSLRTTRMLPKAPHDPPDLIGVRPSYAAIHNLEALEGTFFNTQQDAAAAPLCVLGEKAKVELLGYGPAVGKYIKVNDSWVQVLGVLGRQLTSGSGSGAQGQDLNNAIFIPLNTYLYRFFDNDSLKDDFDGIDLRMKPGTDSVEAAKVVTAILNSTHHNVADFNVVIPADLLAQQQRTQTIFTYVMVAIAAISLLVGGIGIMNIVLATVMERTREIGVRRATGARRNDIVRQFLAESVLISVGGGILGIVFGYFLSWLIARTAEWKTIVTLSSIVIAFSVSVAVGMIFGIYPAVKASRIDPIEALRYE